jgi:hypothetical protein
MIEFEGFTVKGNFVKKIGEFFLFDVIISNRNKSIYYKFNVKEKYVDVSDTSGSFLLTEEGLYEALHCFISESLYEKKHLKNLRYFKSERHEFEWVEHCLIQRKMKPPGKLKTNV